MSNSHQMFLLWFFAPLLVVLLPCGLVGQSNGAAKPDLRRQIVKLGMIVIDSSNHPVDDLRQEDIQVIDDGVPYPLSLLARDDRSVQYTVAIDTSASFRLLLQPTLIAMKLLIENNRPDDRTMLVRFSGSDKITKVQDFTADKAKLLEALKLFQPEPGQTAVVDAVYVSARDTAAYKEGDLTVRRALILVSDGEDRLSYYKQDALFKLLREKDVQVFIIGIVAQLDNEGGLIRASPRQKAEELLSRIAEETGGRVFFPQTVKELLEATNEIIHDLHSQYIVGFEREVAASDKGFRKLKIKISQASARKHLKLITRPGYWLNVHHPIPKADEKKSP